MHTRVLTFRGATNIDSGVDFIRETALPVLRQQAGYQGMFASADRAGGLLGILSLWDTEANRDASFAPLASLRDDGTNVIGGNLEIANYEQVVEETAGTPTPGAALLVTRVSMDPAKLDENIEFFKREVVPRITAAPGFLHLRNMVDRTTGHSLAGSVWADEDAMRNAYEMARARRDEAVARGVSFDEDSFRDVLLADRPG